MNLALPGVDMSHPGTSKRAARLLAKIRGSRAAYLRSQLLGWAEEERQAGNIDRAQSLELAAEATCE